jgi:NAD(P)-dependent dehydrogenase (short-subunit alcohol dehydrogenase family)
LVTGASSGLGRTVALRLAAAGARVVATVRSGADAERLRETALRQGITVNTVILDLLDEPSVRAAAEFVSARIGGLDALVNNAGVELAGPVEDASDDDVRWVLDTNVLGTVRLTRSALPLIRAGSDARILFVSSVVAFAARPFLSVYSASKYAVAGFAESLHWELAPDGIAVSLIEPGRFPTALGANARGSTGEHRQARRFAAALARLEPPGYAPDPGAVADAVLAVLEHPAPPLHVPVGADTEAVERLRARSPFEPYAARMTALLDDETPAHPHERF